MEVLIGGHRGRRIHVTVSGKRPSSSVGGHVAVRAERRRSASSVRVDRIRSVGGRGQGRLDGKARRVGDFGRGAARGCSVIHARAVPIERSVGTVGIRRYGIAGRTKTRRRVTGNRRPARASANPVDGRNVRNVRRTRSVHERPGRTCRDRILYESGNRSGRSGVSSRNDRRARRGRHPHYLEVRN